MKSAVVQHQLLEVDRGAVSIAEVVQNSEQDFGLAGKVVERLHWDLVCFVGMSEV